MKAHMLPILAMGLGLCFTGCSARNSLLASQSDFDRITDAIFDSSHFTRWGGGLSGGDKEIEFTALYGPKNEEAEIAFDFAAWDSFLRAHDTFTGHGEGGAQGLYWRQTWDNRSRFIVLDAVVMKNGNIRVTYREILR